MPNAVVYNGGMKKTCFKSELAQRIEDAVRDGWRAKGSPGDAEEADEAPKKPRLPRPEGAPHWLPRGGFWEELSEGVQRAAGEILVPAYRRLVLEVDDELERSAGMTLVHLMWLEICGQQAMADIVGNRESIYSIVKDPEAQVARHLELLGAKNNTAELLLKLRMVRDMIPDAERRIGPEISVPSLPAPAISPPTASPPEMM